MRWIDEFSFQLWHHCHSGACWQKYSVVQAINICQSLGRLSIHLTFFSIAVLFCVGWCGRFPFLSLLMVRMITAFSIVIRQHSQHRYDRSILTNKIRYLQCSAWWRRYPPLISLQRLERALKWVTVRSPFCDRVPFRHCYRQYGMIRFSWPNHGRRRGSTTQTKDYFSLWQRMWMMKLCDAPNSNDSTAEVTSTSSRVLKR